MRHGDGLKNLVGPEYQVLLAVPCDIRHSLHGSQGKVNLEKWQRLLIQRYGENGGHPSNDEEGIHLCMHEKIAFNILTI